MSGLWSIFTPTVVRYFSEKMPETNRLTRLVLPTAKPLYGDDDYQKVRASYLQGSSGYILVIDGTRKETVDVAIRLHELAGAALGPVPFALLLNKHDLKDEWAVELPMVSDLSKHACLVSTVSAKTGEGVEEAFVALAEAMMRSCL